MGVYLRKGIVRSGPFHVYLNKSGIGVSTGIPGLRVGHGPRGSYVRMGKGGVYYRKTLGSKGRKESHGGSAVAKPEPALVPGAREVELHDVTGSTVLELADASPSELTGQINGAAHAASLMPLVILCYILILTIPLGIWLRAKDAERRSVIVFYDINDEHLLNFEALVDAFSVLEQCAGKWSVTAEGGVQNLQQWKTSAGASTLVTRTTCTFDTEGPKILKTNITVPSFHHAKQTLYLLPDRVLVQEGKRFADLAYDQCRISASATRFIESSGRPARDAQQVGTTWKYVNKGGGPDKRYKDNRQLPIMQYAELEVSSSTGLHLLWQVSRPDAATSMASAVKSSV
jgi:Protein of unknown function (DUF4236)